MCLPNGTILTPKYKDGRYCRLSDNVLRRHLERAYSAGVFSGISGSKFICFDVDDGKHETVERLSDILEGVGIPRRWIYVSYSGGKGYHVEVFFTELIDMHRLRYLYEQIIREGGFDPRKIEFRPTHSAAIKLPLSIHAKTGNVCWYVDPDTLEPIEDERFILGIEQMPAVDFMALVPAEQPEHKPVTNDDGPKVTVRESAKATDATRRLGDVLQEEGTRHNIARNIAVYLRAQGKAKEECLAALMDWYAVQDQTNIRTEHDAAIRDIVELVDWAFSDRFCLPRKSNQDRTLIGTTQMNLVLSQKSRTRRRICFLLLARCRMGRKSISCQDAAKTIGASANAVHRALKNLRESGVIECAYGKRLLLPDGGYSAESSSYTVPHATGRKDELWTEITMRELTFDFDHCYNRALHMLVPRYSLKTALSPDEWVECQRYSTTGASDELDTVKEQRIDLVGIPRSLHHERYG